MFWCIYPHLPRKTTHQMLAFVSHAIKIRVLVDEISHHLQVPCVDSPHRCWRAPRVPLWVPPPSLQCPSCLALPRRWIRHRENPPGAKLRWKMFLWKTLVFFVDVFCVLKMEVDLIFLIKTGSKKDQELYINIYLLLLLQNTCEIRKILLVNYTYGPNATQTFLIKYNQISNHTKSTTPSCIEIHETSDSKKTYG